MHNVESLLRRWNLLHLDGMLPRLTKRLLLVKSTNRLDSGQFAHTKKMEFGDQLTESASTARFAESIFVY